MNPNAKQLAMRDPALASLMGIGPGADSDFGSEYDDDGGSYYGESFGADFGEDYGADFGAAPSLINLAAAGAPGAPAPGLSFTATPAALANPSHPASPLHPANQPAMMALWQNAQIQAGGRKRRETLLDPNVDSTLKVERYSFVLAASLVLGTALAINVSDSPATRLRPQRVIMNAPAPGFVTISEIKVSNVSVTSGAAEDAFGYSALAVGASLDMPTLTPSNKATVQGNYTGFIPASYVAGNAFSFTTAFRGPATLAGG